MSLEGPKDGPTRPHFDYDRNRLQATNLVKNTITRWATGMMLRISLGDKERSDILVFSYQRPEITGSWAAPVEFHQPNARFKKLTEATHKHYHELATTFNRTLSPNGPKTAPDSPQSTIGALKV